MTAAEKERLTYLKSVRYVYFFSSTRSNSFHIYFALICLLYVVGYVSVGGISMEP